MSGWHSKKVGAAVTAAPKVAGRHIRGMGDEGQRMLFELAFSKEVPGTLCEITRYPENFASWGRVPGMGPGDEYRVKALEFRAMASCEINPSVRAEFENLAQAYMRLAEQAERNSQLDLTYETPPIKKSDDGGRA
jgi:hypothetical protein